MQLSIIVPTFNEAPNMAELVGRIEHAVQGIDAEIIVVDDSTDDTPEVVRALAETTSVPRLCWFVWTVRESALVDHFMPKLQDAAQPFSS